MAFYELWNCLEDKGIYAIQDLHIMVKYKKIIINLHFYLIIVNNIKSQYYLNRTQPNMLFNDTDVYGNFADIARNMNKGNLMFND